VPRSLLVLVATALMALGFVRGEGDAGRSLRLGGAVMEMLSGRSSLWVLTCDSGCVGEARTSKGRIVRIDPYHRRVMASAPVEHPISFAVGRRGVYVLDIDRGTVRRLGGRSLRVLATLKLTLPFRFSARDNRFLPEAVAVGRTAVWVATARCALAHVNVLLGRVVGTVRLPCDAFSGMAVAPGAVWLAEGLAGVYRIDPLTNRVSARLHIRVAGLSDGQLNAEQVFVGRRTVLAIGAKAVGTVATTSYGLARIDPTRNHVGAISPLPSGPGGLAVTFGSGSLWVARVGGSTVERIDPETGRVIASVPAAVGNVLALAGGHLWTSSGDGRIVELASRAERR
jgi:hypothetical protein